MNDVIIIGAGLSGLMAGWQAARRGKNVLVLGKGWGATYWLTGCVDVLGYYPVDSSEHVTSPAATVDKLIDENPRHPYSLAGKEALAAALADLQELAEADGYPLEGNLDTNWLLPSGVGTFRPTCLAPRTMTPGDLSRDDSILVVGFHQIMDFFPNVVADNLSKAGIPASYTSLDLPTLRARNFTTATILAGMMEERDFLDEVVGTLKPQVGNAARIAFPAVLGTAIAVEVQERLQNRLGRPVFEIQSLTPSVPGIRLNRILTQAILREGGQVQIGMAAVGAKSENGRVSAVLTETSARKWARRADKFVLATGGILGGGITTDHRGNVEEVIFDLPVNAPATRVDWFYRDFLDKRGHPIYKSGIVVDDAFQPVNGDTAPVYENLHAAGTTLAHAEVIRERSFEGVALATGYAVGQLL